MQATSPPLTPSAAPPRDPDRFIEELICFQICGQELGVPIAAVKETIRAPPLCRLPLCPPYVAGLMNLRGDVVAVLDLGHLLDLPPEPAGPRELRRVVLLRGAARGGAEHGALCGLLVERLTAARRLRQREVRPPPPSLRDATLACLRGVATLSLPEGDDPAGAGGRSILLLDLPRLLQSDRLQLFRRGARPADGGGT